MRDNSNARNISPICRQGVIVYNNVTHGVTASLVVGRYCRIQDLKKLRWLPVKEQLQWHLLKAAQESFYHVHWPEDLQLKVFRHGRTLRSSSGLLLEIPMVSHTFQDQECINFNNLPERIRNCTDFKQLLFTLLTIYLIKLIM